MEVQYLFMEAMKAALENRTIQWEEKVTAEEFSSERNSCGLSECV